MPKICMVIVTGPRQTSERRSKDGAEGAGIQASESTQSQAECVAELGADRALRQVLVHLLLALSARDEMTAGHDSDLAARLGSLGEF